MSWCCGTDIGLKKRIAFVGCAARVSSASELLLNRSEEGTAGTYQAVADADSHGLYDL